MEQYILPSEDHELVGIRHDLPYRGSVAGATACMAVGEHPRLAGGAVVLILPLLIPSVSAISLWNQMFQVDILTPWPVSMLALSTLYWWKCAGSAAVLLYIALTGIPQEKLDAAALDGCGRLDPNTNEYWVGYYNDLCERQLPSIETMKQYAHMLRPLLFLLFPYANTINQEDVCRHLSKANFEKLYKLDQFIF